MIQLYPNGQTDFSVSGIELQPQEASVTWAQNGRYDFSMIIPREKCEGITFDYGMILMVSVPEEETGDIHLGTVSYYTVNADETPLYSKLPSRVRASYDNWTPSRSYMAGDKRTYDKKNWSCRVGHGGRSVPPPDGDLWTQISDYRDVPGTVAATLSAGTQIMVTAEFNADYFEAATIGGATGYIAKDAVTSQGETEERVIPSITITEQCFEIIGIEKEENGHQIRITGQHISYALSRTTLGECNLVNVSPATALIFIAGAMKDAYEGHLYTDISDVEISGDFGWKNAQAALLDPKAGLATVTGGRITRDGLDVYLLANTEGTPEYEVVYGGNLKNVKWNGDVENIVTRVYPLAQREDGSTLLLPEEHIDSVRTVPFVRPEVLNTGLKIGQKVTNSDGTEVELTEADVYSQMREMAQNRFSIDQCDKAEVTLDLDWIHMPDTEEYKAYQGMRNASPNAWIRVVNGPMGLDTVIQMTGYTFDPIKLRYKKATFGTQKASPSVPGYQLASGAVTARALAMGSVGSGAIQAASITAREIEAGSITAEQIAARAITTELLAANAVTANEIAANSITTEKLTANAVTANEIAANSVTTEKLAAQSVTTEKLAAQSITSEKIAAQSITTEKLAAQSITSEKIASKIITAEHIASGTITADEIAGKTITGDKIRGGTITGSLIQGQTITGDHIAGETITGDKISALAITAGKIATGAVTTDKLQAGAVNADKIAANAVTSAKIDAGAVTTVKLAANAITSDKIDAGAVTAQKIEAGAIDASKISTTDLSAIQAKLEIASIASAQIGSADINYLQVKEMSAGSAHFGEAVIQQGLAEKLYVPRLSVGYAQMIGATVGDLVIQASNGDFYGIDVDLNGNVTATKRTVTAGEIASGHTSDGRQLVMDTDILAENLNTNNLTATHALMYKITANIIDVDQLWAREAFVNKLMVQDISSNTYIQSTIGDWSGSSTITQTINGLSSKVSSLGYGTVYMQPNEPSHSELTSGDIWVQTVTEGSWQDVKSKYGSWQQIKNDVSSWQTLGGIPKMYVWDGQKWQEMYDAYLPTKLETDIEQLSDMIALRATREEVEQVTNEVTTFRAELTIQADQIESAVESVNAKASSYVMATDPRLSHDVSLGDIWVQHTLEATTWKGIYDTYSSWTEVYNTYATWWDTLGEKTYVWNGTKWVLTSDRASEVWHQTKITETDREIRLMAQTQASFQDELTTQRAEISVTAAQIRSEVSTVSETVRRKTSIIQDDGQINLSAVTFDNLGETSSGIYITPSEIKVSASGKITIASNKLYIGSQTLEDALAEKGDITAAVQEFYVSTDQSRPIGGSWRTDTPVWSAGKYVWMRTKFSHADGTNTYEPSTDGVCIQGAKGETGSAGPKGDTGAKGEAGSPGSAGPKGDAGADGRGIQSIEYRFKIGTSKATSPGGAWETWSQTVPAYVEGCYYWSWTKTKYTDGTESDLIISELGINAEYDLANDAKSVADGIISGSSKAYYCKAISNTGVNIDDDNLEITSKGNMYVSSGGAIIIRAASSTEQNPRNAVVINKTGIALKTLGTFTIDSGNFSIDGQGNVSMTGYVKATSGEFSGELKAATGTFSGSLSAATGTFSGDLQAAGGTFTGTLSAGCITSGTMTADRISGGTLTLGKANDGGGVLSIQNASGTEIGKWNKDGISATAGKIGGWTIGASSLTSGSGAGYVGLNSSAGGTYAIWAGAESGANAPFSVTRAGSVKATAGQIGDFTVGNGQLWSGSGADCVVLDGRDKAVSGWAMWAGADYADYALYAAAGSPAGRTYDAPFRVSKTGEVTLTKLKVLDEDGTTPTEVNLRTVGLWKLGSANVKNATVSGNTLTISRYRGGDLTVNFNTAASVTLTGTWSGNADSGYTYKVTNNGNDRYSYTTITRTVDADWSTSHTKLITISSTQQLLYQWRIDATSEYNNGVAAGHTDGYAEAKADYEPTGLYYDTDTYRVYAENADGNEVGHDDTIGPAIFKAGIADYYDSSYWAAATAENNWLAKIPNETNTASEDWDCGAGTAYTTGGNAAWASAVAGSSSGRNGNVITSVIPIPGGQYGTYTYTVTADGSITGPNQLTCIARVGNTGVNSKVINLRVNGLTAYSHAGETVYQYVEGKQVSFKIPDDCKTGTPTVGLAT